MVEPGGEMARFRQGLALVERAAFRQPFGQPAVEHRDIAHAKRPECPPHARGRKQAEGIIDHDLHAVANAEFSHGAGKGHRIGQHMRQVGAFVGDRVDVEKHRAGNVAHQKFGAAVALGGRQMP